MATSTAANPTKSETNRQATVWMLLVLAMGVLIRLYAALTLPLSNDELGTVTSVNMPFKGYFQQLVLPDGHPPGYRLFFYGWLNVVGTDLAILVRLPALLAACFGLWFLFKGLKCAAGPTVALVGLIVISFSDYVAFNTVLVRPYAFGFFAVTVLFWSLARLNSFNRFRWKGAIPIAVGWALLMYTHFFAILTGAVLTAGWLVYAAPRWRLPILVASVAGVSLYVPAVPLFFEQLGRGGLGWLPEPSFSFGWQYLYYLFNHSIGWLVVIVLGTLVGFRRLTARQKRLALVMLFSGVVVFLVGYLWSVWKKPVLQYNVLVFSSIFIVGSIAMGWEGIKRSGRTIGLLILTIIGTWSLVVGQQFLTKEQFGDFRQQADFIEEQVMNLQAEGISYAIFVNQNDPDYLHYYLNDSITVFNYQGYFSVSLEYINKVVDSLEPEVIISAWNNVAQSPTTEAWLQWHYPIVSDSLYTFNAGTTVYRKIDSALSNPMDFGCREKIEDGSLVLANTNDTARIFWIGSINKESVSHVVAYAEVVNGSLEGNTRCILYDVEGKVLEDKSFPWFYYPLKGGASRLLVVMAEVPRDREVSKVEWMIWTTTGAPFTVNSMSIYPVCDDRYRVLHPNYWYPLLY